MSNWRERAEQENLRRSSEQESLQRAVEQASKDKVELVRERLGLFEELGIRRTLAEIQRDIWRGQGTIDDEIIGLGERPKERRIDIGLHASGFIRGESARAGFGIKSSRLSGSTWRSVPTKELNYKRVFGEYLVESGDRSYGPSGPSEPTYNQVRGWHNVVDGSKIVGASTLESRTHLSSSLIYLLGNHTYVLVVNGKLSSFSTPDIEKMTKFLDQAFLEYATKADIPDFLASRREAEMEASRIRSRIGEIVR